MKRVLAASGRIVLSVHSAIERTPGAHAFARALDDCLGPNTASIKRAEHIFSGDDEVRILLSAAEFEQINVCTVTKTITFPSVVDYVRFQLVATPMAALLQDRGIDERGAPLGQLPTALDPTSIPTFCAMGVSRFLKNRSSGNVLPTNCPRGRHCDSCPRC